MGKKSIRFFNDREVRAVWDDDNNCWWFSATDVVRAINDEPDYTKAGNYWRWLKRKLKQEGVQFVSGGETGACWDSMGVIKQCQDLHFRAGRQD